ncbi:protein MIZU-KUSSEI 1-like [Amaranthus tricolor]|uniref:protein MIZU-KUSSEI 1-like n=1 Tax=Amaranthus tricolor TaxID=29722 RepID=UPI0025886FCF|nr:protein MIZU-KUSSEI 1-like [Amaranthus tricolor]
MTKIDFLRRILLGCFTIPTPSTTSTLPTTTKKRLSTSLRDDIVFGSFDNTQDSPSCSSPTSTSSDTDSIITQFAPPRPSKSMVICTFFGHRGGHHVFFCVQTNRISPKPSLLLELSISTRNLVKEMGYGVLRIALECKSSELGSCPLHLVPVWTLFCNGRRVGFATRRKANTEIRELLKKMQSITMGAGVILDNKEIEGENEKERREVMYMRANYDWVIGGADSESFHLINGIDESSSQELSVFLLRSV